MTTNRLASVLILAALTACSGLPKYADPRSPDAAVITNWSHLTLCSIKGIPGPGEWPNRLTACAARVIVIDGAQVTGYNPVSVTPGTHKIMLSCQTDSPDGRSFGQSFQVQFAPRTKYHVQPRWEQSTCVVDIFDSTTKQVVPMEPVLRAGP